MRRLIASTVLYLSVFMPVGTVDFCLLNFCIFNDSSSLIVLRRIRDARTLPSDPHVK